MNVPRSAYLHIPFCYKRCFYCDFAVVPVGGKHKQSFDSPNPLIDSYLNLLEREISLTPECEPLSTVYIGGGTPSLLTYQEINFLLNILRQKFGFQPGVEITLEIDPASFNKMELEGYIKSGVNRVSLGAQSFDTNILKEIGRSHDRDDLIQSCSWIREFFEKGELKSWNLDLIQSLPSQDCKSWEDQINQAIRTAVPHLSIYDLSIEPGTAFANWDLLGKLNLPNEESSWQMMRSTSSMLREAGFARYEISNFSLPGHPSRHNRVYWNGSGWWGFGQGATSAPWGLRFMRPKTFNEYRSWVFQQEQEGIHSSLISSNARPMPLDELLIVGLRRREGVELYSMFRDWGWSKTQCEIYIKSLISKWLPSIQNGLLIQNGFRFYLTDPEGMNLSNEVLVQMMLWWESLPNDAVEPSIS